MSDEDSRESATPSPTFCEGIERQDRVHRPNVDYGGDTEFSCCSIQSDALFSFDTYKWEDDDSALRSAAIQSRLPYDKMTDHELKFFPEFANQGSSLQFYLFVRNKILTLWHLDPLLELTFEAVLKEIPPPFNSDKKTLAGIHSYLQRYGLINYGVFMDLSKMKLSTPKRVIVIGAGIAGLAAARQLKFFGFEVTVLEGRRRIGGRIMTLRKEKNIDVDLGANIIQGIVGNPIVTLLQQMPLNISKFETQCPLFDNNGKPLDPRRTEMLRKSFLRILNAAKLVASQVTQIAGRKLSLGETIEHILSQHNLRVQNRRLKFWKKYIEIYTKLDHVNKKMAIVRDAIQQCMSQLESLSPGLTTTEFNPEKNNPFEIDSSINDEEYEKIITMRSVRQIIVKCIEQYEQCEKEHREIQNILIDFKNMEPSQSYLNVRDFRIFNWFLAGIEYMVGTSLNNCSLRDWNNGEKYLFEGSHMTVREGMGALIDELSRDLEVKIDHVVEGINYSNNNNVMVTCSVKEKCDDESDFKRCKKNFFADAVLCTVPLGILKRTPRTNEPSKADVSIRFEPDLPELKRKAIANIGFGTINKLVLLFDHSFWEDASVFGRLSESVSSRGEFFLFIASEDKDRPFIVCLMVGASSMLIPKINEEMLVTKAIAILTQIFGTSCPRRPRHHAVTIWERDRFSCGAGSYSHPGTNLSDFERIKDPLYSPSGSSSVFFAGEHTASQYLGTIHGAFISGLRAAAEIADSLIGLPVSAATTSAPSVNVVVEESTVAQTSYSSRVGMTLQEGMHTLVNPNIPKRPSPTNGENKNPSSPS